MSTTAPDADDRYPTTGPEEGSYDRYRFETTTDGEALVYDTEAADAWIQAESAVSLADWR